MLIFDAHLDLSMNAIEWNRDLRRPVEEIRAREHALRDRPDRGHGTVSFPAMRQGGVGLCVATQIARYVEPSNPLPGWHSPEQAWAMSQGQLAWYRAMEEDGELARITDSATLERQLSAWRDPADGAAASRPIGYVLSLEGADSILSPRHLEPAWASGLRAIGPAHYGPGTYAQGTDATGGLGSRGRELLREMDRLGFILDVTHLCDDSFWEAIDLFKGPLWASHSNCRALVPHNRQLTDEQLRCLIDRNAPIGAVLDAWMLVPGWQRGVTTPLDAGVTLDTVIDHIDHVCQLAGNAYHAMIGSDLDGAFGFEQTPADVQTIADLARVPERLRARGYRDEDVQLIAHGNLVRALRAAWR
jgi:membrane dipeptidase